MEKANNNLALGENLQPERRASTASFWQPSPSNQLLMCGPCACLRPEHQPEIIILGRRSPSRL